MAGTKTPPDAVDYCSEARSIDHGLRSLARTIANDIQQFKALIDEARTKHIHGLLGFTSWTAYVADVIGKEMTAVPVDDRRQIVALLAGEGMSTRAIGDALGVSNATVSRDQQVLHDVTPPVTVTGRDGKAYPAKPKPKPKPDVPKPEPKPAPENPPAEGGELAPLSDAQVSLLLTKWRLESMSKRLRSERPLQFSSDEGTLLADILSETIIPMIEEGLGDEDTTGEDA